jgi:hypothetical protein
MWRGTGLSGCTTSKTQETGNLHQELDPASFYLQKEEREQVVTVSTTGTASAQ